MCCLTPVPGIFFSKDRKEEVIEIEEVPETMAVPGMNDVVPLLTQGQWMKGCPEGSEQTFLFSLYSKLSSPFPCGQDCGASIPRKKVDFFALYVSQPFLLYWIIDIHFQPEFSTYIDRVRNTVIKLCPRCHSRVCLACQETISLDPGRHSSSKENVLFHCADLQGVILGVGLTMLEQLFEQRTRDQAEAVDTVIDQSARNSKRRKIDINSSHDVDDEDIVYYANVGKKQKGGIGYDGDASEDVMFSPSSPFSLSYSFKLIDNRPGQSFSYAKSKGRNDWQTACGCSRLPS